MVYCPNAVTRTNYFVDHLGIQAFLPKGDLAEVKDALLEGHERCGGEEGRERRGGTKLTLQVKEKPIQRRKILLQIPLDFWSIS